MRKQLIAAAFGGVLASVFLAGAAHAAPGDQRRLDDFINYMAAHGYPGNMSPGRNVSYSDQGFQVCDALKQGQSERSQIGRLEGILSRAEAQLVVTGAEQIICPGVS